MIDLLATVMLSYLSALGLGWIVLHHIFDVTEIQGLIPLYAFVFLVALDEDYNIFLASTIWRKRKEMPLKKAIADSVGETGSVISSAGLILAGTFSVLAVLPLQVLVHFKRLPQSEFYLIHLSSDRYSCPQLRRHSEDTLFDQGNYGNSKRKTVMNLTINEGHIVNSSRQHHYLGSKVR